MGRIEENPVSDEPTFDDQLPPPEGYQNQYDNPLTSQEPIQSYASEPVATPSQQPPAAAYPQPAAYPPQPAVTHSQSTAYPPPAAYKQPSAATYAQPAAYSQPPAVSYAQPAAYPQPPATTYAQPAPYPQQPAPYPQQSAAYPQPPATTYAQPAAYPQPTAYAPQSPMGTNGSTCDPKMYSYTPNHSCQPQVTTGTPNWVQAPPMAMNTQEWSTGLLDCLDDPENAFMTLFFPCITFGQIAEIVDNGQTSCATSALIYSLIQAFIYTPCIISCSYRTKIRSRYNLFETPAPDWAIHFFCEYCALCQEYRELKNRGMDPALGWQGNLNKHQQMANAATMVPPVNQRMMG